MEWLKEFFEASPEWTLLLRVTVATVLAIPLGLEREMRDRPAGLRTHMLVALGSSLLTVIGEVMVARYGPIHGVVPDPTRIIHAIVLGIGFIGAGTIVVRRDEGVVVGLTTAANLLAVAAMAIVVGLGLYRLGVAITLLALIVVGGFGALERRYTKDKDDSPDES